MERVLVWGGGAVVCFVAGSSGAHPAVAAALGVTGAILIAAVLTAAATT